MKTIKNITMIAFVLLGFHTYSQDADKAKALLDEVSTKVKSYNNISIDFKYALQNDYDFIFEMDADFSHDPKELKNYLQAIKEFDLVLGSRYINGVRVLNWPMARLLLSFFAPAECYSIAD